MVWRRLQSPGAFLVLGCLAGWYQSFFWGWRYLVPFRGFAVTAVVLDLVRPRLLLLEPIIPGAAWVILDSSLPVLCRLILLWFRLPGGLRREKYQGAEWVISDVSRRFCIFWLIKGNTEIMCSFRTVSSCGKLPLDNGDRQWYYIIMPILYNEAE